MIELKGTPARTDIDSNSGTWIGAVPSGIVAGELLMSVVFIKAGAVPSSSSGMTQIIRKADTQNLINASVWRKVATGSETESRFTLPSNQQGTVVTFRTADQHPAAPIGNTASDETNGNTSVPALGVTTVERDELVMAFYMSSDDVGFEGPLTGWSEYFEYFSSADDRTCYGMYRHYQNPTSIGSLSLDLTSGAPSAGVSVTVALRSAMWEAVGGALL